MREETELRELFESLMMFFLIIFTCNTFTTCFEKHVLSDERWENLLLALYSKIPQIYLSLIIWWMLKDKRASKSVLSESVMQIVVRIVQTSLRNSLTSIFPIPW